jgi:Fe-S cluster assembly iron-binding protein IscA
MNITLSARLKVLELSTLGKPFRIQVTGNLVAGNHVDLFPNAEASTSDITICSMPFVIADMASVNYLTGQTIDFDNMNEEFIISKRGSE